MGLFDWFKKKEGASSQARSESLVIDLSRSAAALAAQDRRGEAIRLFQQAVDAARSHLGKAHPLYAVSLHNLALTHQAMGDYSAALPLHQNALEVFRATLGEAHPQFAHSLNNLASVHSTMGHHAAALPLLERAAEITRATLGQAHPLYADSLHNLVMVHTAMGDHAAALPLQRRAAEIRRAALGEAHPDYAASLHNLAVVHTAMGDRVAALPLLKRAVEIRRAALGEAHPLYAQSLHSLVAVHRAMGDHAAALPLLERAAEITCAALGQAHPLYAQSLYNLANVHATMGDHAAALPLLERAAEIRRAALGEADPDYAQSLHSLAAAHHAMGDFTAALPLYGRAAEITRTALGEAHPNYAASLNGLALVHTAMGDHAAALPLYGRAAEITRTALGEAHPLYAQSLHNLALVHWAMGDHAAALPLHHQAAEITRAALGEGHPDYAASLIGLGDVRAALGDHAAALPLLERAAAITRAALGEAHPLYAASLTSLVAVYHAMGDHAAALPLQRRAAEIRRAAQGEAHPDYTQSLHNLALVLTAADRPTEALSLLEQAAAIDDRMIGQVFSIGSERQRIAFLWTLRRRFYATLSLVLEHLGESPAAVRSALDLVLRRKAITAEATAVQRDAVLGGKYPALRPMIQGLGALRLQIARATLAGPGLEGLESHMRRLAEWLAQRELLEAELARQIPEMDLEKNLRAADRRAVALGLPVGVALVEFVRLPITNFHAVPARGEQVWKPARYVAFILSADDPDDVWMIDLGEAEPIDRMIADFRAGITAEAEVGHDRDMRRRRDLATLSPSDTGWALREVLFDKLAPALGGRSRLLIAPDGDLTRLPLEVLPTADGSRLIDDYRISYLSCGRDVLRLGAAATGRPNAPLVVADPDFDLEAEGRPIADLEDSTRTTGRRSRDLDRDRGAYHFHRLPGTRAEGRRVGTLLDVEPWLDGEALEGRLKAECRSPRILHLATHGFFLPNQESNLERGSLAIGPSDGPMGDGGRLSGPMMENPMLRSGLALAGANTFLKAGNPPKQAEDGLLTAEDVTGLDLLATELVVLSACETGLGQVHGGEGVFGLRRAFVLAGARTLVMSLWKVPDEPTRALMEDFYGRLLAGQGRAEALREAQLAMKAKYPDPFYWGAFICQGDPSPLSIVRPGIAGTGVATDLPTGTGIPPNRS